ncbi:DNA polymerase accessory (sliding clamp loader) protein [Rhizobium phage RHph_I1_18]|nr:DNA polymerase accessory (sliding clamp loader) protein [Rhizobium phage RHph_I1_18]
MLDAVWVEKYRPQTIEECILPLKTKRDLNKIIRDREIPNMLFVGTSGIGKTTAAHAIMRELDIDYIKINASLEGNIDTIRSRVIQHASTVSFNGTKKFVVYEEVDNMSVAAQKALRAFIEEYSANCGHIFTGNTAPQDLAIMSRLERVNFTFEKSELPKLAGQVFNMLKRILKAENVEYEDAAVQHLIVEHLKRSRDIRQLLILVQKFSRHGKFEPDLTRIDNVRYEQLVQALKSKKIKELRTWAGENSDLDPIAVFTFLYENVDTIATPVGIAPMIAHVAEHQFQHAFAANPEINMAALLIDIASECV